MTIKDPTERKKLFKLNASLLLIFVVLIGGGYLAQGLDFAKATLVGCIVVAINFFLSQRLLGRLLFEKKLRVVLVLSYLFKFALSMAILFFAVTRWNMDLIGLMLGLSSIFLSVVFTTFLKVEQTEETDG